MKHPFLLVVLMLLSGCGSDTTPAPDEAASAPEIEASVNVAQNQAEEAKARAGETD